MNCIAVGVLVVAAACGRGKSDREARPTGPPADDAPTAAAPKATSRVGICDTTKLLVERAIACAPPDAAKPLRGAVRGLEEYLATATGPGAPASAGEQATATCAALAKDLDDDLAGADPACRLTGDERTRNTAFLDAYYGRRTRPRPSGDARVDENLRKLDEARDAMCACADEECVRTNHARVNEILAPVPRHLTTAMEDAGAISDEVTRCAERVERNPANARLRE